MAPRQRQSIKIMHTNAFLIGSVKAQAAGASSLWLLAQKALK